jgi:hypothetical protein
MLTANACFATCFFQFGRVCCAGFPHRCVLSLLAQSSRQPKMLKMKKFPIFAPRPKDNVGLPEAIKALRRQHAGRVIQ